MATLQIRTVPDAVHRIYQARTAPAGKSLQAYLLAELVQNAARRPPSEVIAEVDGRMRIEGHDGYAQVSSAELIRADREWH